MLFTTPSENARFARAELEAIACRQLGELAELLRVGLLEREVTSDQALAGEKQTH